MSRPAASTPKKRARLRELRASGLGLRPAAEALGVSHMTAARWEREDAKRGLGAMTSSGARAATKTPRPAKPTARAAREARAVLAAALPLPEDPEALAMLRARARLVADLLRRLTPAVESGEYSPTSFVTLAKYGDELARLIAELTPPPPRDPDSDPSILEAERALLAKLEGLIAEARP